MLTNHYRARDYRTARSLNEAFGPYAEMTVARDKRISERALDWIAAICTGIGAGTAIYLVVAFASGAH